MACAHSVGNFRARSGLRFSGPICHLSCPYRVESNDECGGSKFNFMAGYANDFTGNRRNSNCDS